MLQGMARLSTEGTQIASVHDPLTGTLLALGSTRDEAVNARVPIAIFVSEPTKRTLGIIKLESQRQGWADSKDTFLRVPQVSGERGEWRSPAPNRRQTLALK